MTTSVAEQILWQLECLTWLVSALLVVGVLSWLLRGHR